MTLRFETGEHWLEGDVPVVWVAGELDLATRDRVKSRLTELASTSSALIVDLRRCTFIDSSALALLAQLHKELSSRNGGTPGLALLVSSREVSRTLELTSLDQVVPVVADPDAAVTALNGSKGPRR
jgi:anti-anti-sigma factor